MSVSPDSPFVKPLPFGTSKCACNLGRRRSQSTIRHSAPVWASMNAVLIAVVVLPSEGWLDVTRIVFGGCPADERSNEVRKWRYDSAIDERASSIIARAVVSEGEPGGELGIPISLARSPLLAGIKANAGMCK